MIGYFIGGIDVAKGLLFGAFIALVNAWVYKIFFTIQAINLTASPSTSVRLLITSLALRMIIVIGLLFLGFRLGVEPKLMLLAFVIGQVASMVDKFNFKEMKHGK